MKAKNKYIFIQQIIEEKKSESGLFLSQSESNEMRYQKAKVIATGDLVEINLDGSVILYDRANAFDVVIDEVKYTVIREDGVIAIL